MVDNMAGEMISNCGF